MALDIDGMDFPRRGLLVILAMLGAAGTLAAADNASSSYNPNTPDSSDQANNPPPVAARQAWSSMVITQAQGELNLWPAPILKSSRQLLPLPRNSVEPRPTFIAADRISGKNDVETVAQGSVELRRVGRTLTTEHLTYWQDEDQIEAVGNVRFIQEDDFIIGPRMRLKLKDNVGFFEEPQYTIMRAASGKTGGMPGQLTSGSGQARRIDFEGEDHYRLSDATYSTCRPGNPDWYVRSDSLSLDYSREVGVAHDATLTFQGVPILYAPWFSFSLNNQRKSGLLTPTFGTTSKGGIEMTFPYYWNIAPDMDATISPRVISKRGVQWGSEFRYLDQNYNGMVRGEYLPDDRIAHLSRSNISVSHAQNFGRGFTGSLNLNGVSDDSYFSDLSSRLTNIAQNNLLRQGVLSYGGSWWSASLMAQRFQTLQDPALPPVGVPYHRLPQLILNAYRADFPLGSAFTFSGEYVNFSHPTQALAKRTSLYPLLSLPLLTAAFYITPKIGLHSTHYSLERQATGTPAQLTRNVPTFSIDSGVFFERNTDWFGQNLTQTLEPRLYYLYVPTRDQSLIPVFDTGLADFNFAQIFSDNRYVGSDRIGDANQATVALTSRLIDPASGSELLRAVIGQRYYFKLQDVTLPGETARTTKTADFLAALSGKVLPRISLDSGWQYNPRDKRTERLTLGARYQPEVAKVINAGYRYSRDLLGQLDASVQWPLWGGWSGVGRYNYSLKENRIIETIGGLEYNAGCWASRFVVQRIATAAGQSSSAFFVQLELNGFSNIGSNPMEMLKRNIPGYGRINQPVADPAFAAN